MVQRIDVPGHGIVEFPDEMSEDDIRTAIENNASSSSLFNAQPQSFGQKLATGLAAESSEMGGQTPKESALGTSELAKGIPIAGALVPQTAAMTEFEKADPSAAKTAQGIGGALATVPATVAAPWAFGLKAGAPLVENMIAGATVGGAGLSAADAAARGQPITPAAIGGAVMGSAVPLVGRGVSAFGSAVWGAIRPEAQNVLKGIDPMAIEWAVTDARRSGLTEDQIANMINIKGPEAFLGEYAAPFQGRMQGMVSTPGAAQGTVKGAFEERAAGAYGRFDQTTSDVLGPRVNVADLTREGWAERTENAAPFYEQWRTAQVHPTDELKALIPRLQSVGAFGTARAKAAAEGVPFDENFFTTGPQKNYPTAQSWDYVKRSLDDRIAGSLNSNGTASDWTRILRNLKTETMTAIENSNSEGAKAWKQGRQAWADPTSIINARNEGMKAFDPSVTRDELAYKLTDYSAPERAAYKEGVRYRLGEDLDAVTRGTEGNEQVMASARNRLLAKTNQDKLSLIADNKDVNSQDLINRAQHEAGYAKSQAETYQMTQTAQRREAAAEVKPNPEQTWVARALERLHYIPGVTLSPYIPGTGAAKSWAASRQAQQFEAARDALSKLYVTQGGTAQNVARALINRYPQGEQPLIDQLGATIRALSTPAPSIAQNRQP